jgi:hypothetical protein
MASRSSAFDQQALISMMAEASAKQTDKVRQAVYDATLKTLEGRELTLQNIRSTLKSVSQVTSAGAAKSGLPGADVEVMLESAVKGMDDALLRAVEAYRVGASKMIDQGLSTQDEVLQKAVDTVEKMEDALFKAVSQASQGAGQLDKPWAAVLEKMQMKGTGTGAQATQAVEQLGQQMQQAVRESRAASVRAASVFAQSWGALVSGVLIGMSDAMKQGSGAAAAKPAAAAKTKK